MLPVPGSIYANDLPNKEKYKISISVKNLIYYLQLSNKINKSIK